jgi:undecaprenyl-diphosphatase
LLLAAVARHLTFFQATLIGLLQGVTELFPISSLGHSVLIPSLLGWQDLVKGQSAGESFYLAFIVGLHCASALALLWFYRRDWVRIIAAFFRTIGKRKIESSDERLAWLIVIATIPVGILGLAFEHTLRTIFAKPLAAACFLTINGCILLAGERVRRRSEVKALAIKEGTEEDGFRRLDTLEYKEAGIIGLGQSLALLAGISRSGITMVAGLIRGLDHEDAVKFSFLLATPVIFAAGLYKLGDLTGPLGQQAGRGQILAGSIVAGLASYASVRFLTRYFRTRTLTPFGVYCLIAGPLFIVHSLIYA